MIRTFVISLGFMFGSLSFAATCTYTIFCQNDNFIQTIQNGTPSSGKKCEGKMGNEDIKADLELWCKKGATTTSVVVPLE